MDVWVAISAIAVAAFAAAVIASLVLIRLGRYRRAPERLVELEEFSLDRYAPMGRLLGSGDLEFLRTRAKCQPRLAAEWKKARVRIFRTYLRDLASDFQRIHAQLRAVIAQSPEQYADLVGVAMRQQLHFWRALAVMELRLTLLGAGIKPADVRRLLEPAVALQAAIARCQPLSAQA